MLIVLRRLSPLLHSLLLSLLLAGCAVAPVEPPKTERLSGEALESLLPQPVAAVSVDDLVVLSGKGLSSDEIIGRISTSHSRYRLSVSQLLALHRQGVDKKVLDHIVDAERRAVFDDMAGEMAKRDQACRETIVREVRSCQALCSAHAWPGHPFGPCWPHYPFFPCR